MGYRVALGVIVDDLNEAARRATIIAERPKPLEPQPMTRAMRDAVRREVSVDAAHRDELLAVELAMF